MARRRKPQSDQRADLRGGGFVGLPAVVHRSEAYRSLPVFERAVLIEILAAFNGYNNGKIALSQRQISDALGNTNFRKIGKAVAVLMERGLIDVVHEGVWKQGKAREYRLTFIGTGSPPYTVHATNDYLRWQKFGADDASAKNGPTDDTVSAKAKNTDDTVSANIPDKPQKCVKRSGFFADASSSLISKPYRGPSNTGQLDGLISPRKPNFENRPAPADAGNSSEGLESLRADVKQFLHGRSRDDGEALAGWAGIPLDAFGRFLVLGGGLTAQQRKALPLALESMERANA